MLLMVVALTVSGPLHRPGSLSAQQSGGVGELRGVVRGEERDPLGGVSVTLVEIELGAVTDAWGRFALEAVPAGAYTVRFQGLGWAPKELPVEIGAGSARSLEVTLSIEAVPLSPLTVIEQRTRLTGVSADLPGSAHVLLEEDLDRLISPYDDIHQLLRQVPGLNVQEEDGFGLRPNIGMRGSGSERSAKITLMEDGVLIAPAPYAAPAAYYFPVAGRMEAIEIRKGSSQIKYGPQTVGGALNLVSSSIPSGFGWELESAVGPYSSRRLKARAGGSSARFGWLAETYQVGTDGFKRLAGGKTGFDIHDYVAKLRWNSDPASAGFYQQLELKLGYYDERSDETYLGLTEADFRADPRRRYPASAEDVMKADHRQLQVRHFLRLGEALDLTTTLYRNDFGRNWYKLQSVDGTGIATVLDAPESFPDEMEILRGADSGAGALRARANARDYYAHGIQTAIGSRLAAFGLEHEVEIGVRYHRDQEDRFQHEDDYRMIGGLMELERAGAPGSQSNRVSDAGAWALYLEDRIRLGRLAVTAGVRYETIDFSREDYASDDPGRVSPSRVRTNGVDVLLPGMGVSYELGLARLFGGVHRGFGPPGPGVDASTEAESSLNYELGTAIERPGLAGQLVWFFNDYENILGASTLASGTRGTGELFNGGAALIWGVEASADYDPAARLEGVSIPLRVAYTYTNARFRTSFESDFEAWGAVRAGDELPYVSPHQLYASLAVARDRWRVQLGLTYSAAMRTVAGRGPIPGGSGTDPYALLSLGAEARLGRWGTLFAGVQNLTDEAYVVARRPAGARPGLPRAIEVGLRVKP